jgi:hypothetical protein
VQRARGDRSLLPFSHGNRACSHVFCCVAEMFFSSFFILFIVIVYTLWAAKVLISFDLTKGKRIFAHFFYGFF